jgi:hypothetical protein
MAAASDYHAARPAFHSMNEPSAEYLLPSTIKGQPGSQYRLISYELPGSAAINYAGIVTETELPVHNGGLFRGAHSRVEALPR